ncbi:hypothetical protein JQX13_14380 [Archangium violaceum]|uniref:hypothetical protein n=1 Tax=Archangium violaceum TaxID=83451 RepID=UPI00193AE369|nr:hypothetical protein [Archangium violaceum]QRK11149.1 hypothetical protein JQX13_14380 [Archangium violaceum]
MPDSGAPNSKIGPTQGIAGGPPSTKVAGGTAPPGGGHAPISKTTGAKSATTRAEAPSGEQEASDKVYAVVSTEDEETEKRGSPEETGRWAPSE